VKPEDAKAPVPSSKDDKSKARTAAKQAPRK